LFHLVALSDREGISSIILSITIFAITNMQVYWLAINAPMKPHFNLCLLLSLFTLIFWTIQPTELLHANSTADSLSFPFSRHHYGVQLTPLANVVAPAVQFQYLYRYSPKHAAKIELGGLYSPYFKGDQETRGIRAELSYISFSRDYRMWGITLGGRYALHSGDNVEIERFTGTLVDVVSRDNIEMRSRLGGIWYMMGGQFLKGERWYTQLELLLGLIVYERRGLNVPRGEIIYRGDSFIDFMQPNAFRPRVLPSIRVYYSWGRRSIERPIDPPNASPRRRN